MVGTMDKPNITPLRRKAKYCLAKYGYVAEAVPAGYSSSDAMGHLVYRKRSWQPAAMATDTLSRTPFGPLIQIGFCPPEASMMK